jgi:NAD(P)-dependent dehydrogenase (short-subunit alcohol dehydrogenase family)
MGNPNGPLSGQVAVVSGGGKGIGRAICVHLASLGASVVVNNRNRTAGPDGRGPADYVVEEITSAGGQAVADYSDAADPNSGAAMVDLALATWGRLDICIPNAGVTRPAMFHKQADEDLVTVMETNFFGAARLAKAAMAVMRPAGYGRIVLVSSTGGFHGVIGEGAYAASKGALNALGRTLAGEGVGRGVRTNVLMPYATTQMTEEGISSDSVRSWMSTDVVAPVVGALVDPRCELNGEMLIVGGGRLRRATPVEWDPVDLPDGTLDPDELTKLVAQSGAGSPSEYPDGLTAFLALVPATLS